LTINTIEQLREWFLAIQINSAIARSQFAMRAWERALDNPSKAMIFSFYHCARIGIYDDVQIKWTEIKD